MADNSVFITGAAGGAFVDALNGLPPWATENTALNIEKALRIQNKSLSELVKRSGKSAGSGSNESATQSELNKLLIEESKQRRKDLADAKKKEKKDKEKQDKDALWGKKVDSVNAAWVVVMASLVKFGDKVKATLIGNIDTYDELQRSGINVVAGFDKASTGFDALSQITALTGVRYTELQASMIKYNTAINAFTAGKFAKTVGIASEELTQFGYSAKETAELTGAYLESQKGFTDNRNKSEQEVAEEVVKFGKRITDVSMATGMMRGKILENLNAISKSTEAALLTGKVGADQSEKVQEFIASFADQKLGNEILHMMTDAVKPLNATFSAMQKTGGGAFAQAEMTLVNHLKQSGASAEEMQASMASFVSANESQIKRQMAQNNLLAANGNQEAIISNEHLNLLLQQQKNFRSMTVDERKKLEATNKASKDFANAMERLRSQFQRSFAMLTPVLNGITAVLSGFNWVIESIVDLLGPTVTSFIGMIAVGLSSILTVIGSFRLLSSVLSFVGPALSGVARMLMSPFKILASVVESVIPRLVSMLNPITKVVAAFTAGYAIGTFIYEMIKDFKWFNTMMDTIFSGLDHILQYLPGSVGSDAKERITNSEKLSASASKPTEISVPKNPTPSTIDSPSATKTSGPDDASTRTSAPTPITASPPGKEKSTDNADINSLMASHNTLLEQLLSAMHSSVSVNKDILRYTKNQA